MAQQPPTQQVQTWLTDDAGEAWQRGAATRAQYMARATELMLELAGVAPGARVLDIGAGTGDQSLDAARLVGPSGSVLATDNAPSMLAVAAREAQAARLIQVHTQVVDAQDIGATLPAESFDAAICRNGLMFVPDLGRALAGIRQVLKPGARFATTVWASAEKNPYMSVSVAVAERRLGPGSPPLTVGLALSLGAPGLLDGAFRAAGFRDVAVHSAPVNREYLSAAEAVSSMRSRATPSSEGIHRLPEAEQEAAWAEVEAQLRAFETPRGCSIPGEALVVVGAR
ncbi:MAG TPA: class I SAM-dependent methyltransferase [Chloroflexota bacterium]|nr:class I SAM-dependent methyltransferase [Chloroflexota bacterium]